jgi:hypothetical protein
MIRTAAFVRLALATSGLLSLAACTVSSPTLQDTRTLEVSVAPGSGFMIEAGSGSLELQGEADRSTIEVEAEIWQVEPNDDYTLTLETDGDGVARLVSRHGSGIGANADRIDLSVVVPESLELHVDDGSGSVRVSDLTGNVEIDDGSGSIAAARIGGDLTVDDGSGSFRAEDIGGSLSIQDNSGSITIDGIDGDVTIDDGSGSITVRNVGGVVSVSDGSGSINVDGAGDFDLRDDGSGSVNVDNIRRAERR